jgi:hypothetical protein
MSLLILVTWLTHLRSGYFVFAKLARILPSMAASPYLPEQYPRPSTVFWEQETAPMANPIFRIWTDWQRLAMSFR